MESNLVEDHANALDKVRLMVVWNWLQMIPAVLCGFVFAFGFGDSASGGYPRIKLVGSSWKLVMQGDVFEENSQ